MADLDPAELAKRNVPLLVVYVLAILPLPIWYFVVQAGIREGKKPSVKDAQRQLKGQTSKIGTMAQQIKAAPGSGTQPLYTTHYVTAYNKRAEALKAQISKLEDQIRERDKALERWFEAPQFNNLKPGQEPDIADYKEYWKSTAMNGLLEAYRDLVFAGEGSEPHLYTTPPAADTMRRDQKRFWVQKALLESIQSGAQNTIRIANKDIPARLLSPVQFEAAAGPRRNAENEEKPVVTTFSANVEFLCSFRDVGPICQQVLGQDVPMQILSLEISKHAFRYEDKKLRIDVQGDEKVFMDNHYTVDLKDQPFAGEDKLETYIPEPPVRVALRVDVLDFDLPPAKKAEGEAAE